MKWKFCYEALEIYLLELSINFQAAVDSAYNLWFSTSTVTIQGLSVEEVVLNQWALSTINSKWPKSNWKKPHIFSLQWHQHYNLSLAQPRLLVGPFIPWSLNKMHSSLYCIPGKICLLIFRVLCKAFGENDRRERIEFWGICLIYRFDDLGWFIWWVWVVCVMVCILCSIFLWLDSQQCSVSCIS